MLTVTWGLFSVPAYGNESYWKNLESGDPDTVQFHNRVYGCSGVQPKRFPCNGPKFRWVFCFEFFFLYTNLIFFVTLGTKILLLCLRLNILILSTGQTCLRKQEQSVSKTCKKLFQMNHHISTLNFTYFFK